MKLILALLIIFFSYAVSAALPEYLNSLPTTSQELSFTKEKLTELLEPMGYDLSDESLNISEQIALPGLGRTVRIMTPSFAIRTVLFSVVEHSTSKKLSGFIYLVVADKNAEKDLNVGVFNSTVKKIKSLSSFTPKNEYFLLLLSKNIDPHSFTADISPLDLSLNQVRK